jgi:hypothetical protein
VRDEKKVSCWQQVLKIYLPEMNNIFVHENYVTKNYYDLA